MATAGIFSGFGSIATNLVHTITSAFFWFFVIVLVAFCIILGILFTRRAGKYAWQVFIYRDYGNGKAGFNTTRAGKFRRKKMFFNLIERGGEFAIECKDGCEIQDASDNDMHFINGKLGYVVYQKADDKRIYLPISKLNLDDASKKQILMQIAPADFRGSSKNIKTKNEQEMMQGIERWLPLIEIIAMGLFIFLSIIFIMQYANHAVDKAGELVMQAKMACPTAIATPSSAP